MSPAEYCRHNLITQDCPTCRPPLSLFDAPEPSDEANGFDLEEARRLRDEGVRRVRREQFSEAVGRVVDTMVGRTIRGEHIRAECMRRGVEPHHPNAWGGVVQGLVKSGRLRWTGRYEQAKAKKTHAHSYKVYEVVA